MQGDHCTLVFKKEKKRKMRSNKPQLRSINNRKSMKKPSQKTSLQKDHFCTYWKNQTIVHWGSRKIGLFYSQKKKTNWLGSVSRRIQEQGRVNYCGTCCKNQTIVHWIWGLVILEKWKKSREKRAGKKKFVVDSRKKNDPIYWIFDLIKKSKVIIHSFCKQITIYRLTLSITLIWLFF